MKKYADKYSWTLLYFDGFAGSGHILSDSGKKSPVMGAAKRILDISIPRSFDIYYFVEKEKPLADLLRSVTVEAFPNKKIYIANTDCNEKIESLSKFLLTQKGKGFKSLAYIDPYSMQLNWKSLQTNQMLFNVKNKLIIGNDTLASLTLLIASSKPDEMEKVKKLVISVLNKNK